MVQRESYFKVSDSLVSGKTKAVICEIARKTKLVL